MLVSWVLPKMNIHLNGVSSLKSLRMSCELLIRCYHYKKNMFLYNSWSSDNGKKKLIEIQWREHTCDKNKFLCCRCLLIYISNSDFLSVWRALSPSLPHSIYPLFLCILVQLSLNFYITLYNSVWASSSLYMFHISFCTPRSVFLLDPSILQYWFIYCLTLGQYQSSISTI